MSLFLPQRHRVHRGAKNVIRAKIPLLHLTLMELQNSLEAHEDLENSNVILPDILMIQSQEEIDIYTLSEYIKAQER